MTSKFHLCITSDGHIVEGLLTGGNESDISVADDLTEEVYGCYVVEDKGYDSDSHRSELRSKGNIPVIPGRRNRKVKIIYDKMKYQLRRNIEIFFGKMKENKRLAMRFDKTDDAFLGFIAVAAIKILLKLKIS